MTGKRKLHLGAHRRLAIVLFAFIGGIFLAVLYPALWFTPPYTLLTPFVYVGVSALWIPIAFRHNLRYGLNRWLVGLMIACLLSTGTMFSLQYEAYFQYSADIDLQCATIGNGICEFSSKGCRGALMDFDRIDYSPFMVMTNWSAYDRLCFDLF